MKKKIALPSFLLNAIHTKLSLVSFFLFSVVVVHLFADNMCVAGWFFGCDDLFLPFFSPLFFLDDEIFVVVAEFLNQKEKEN